MCVSLPSRVLSMSARSLGVMVGKAYGTFIFLIQFCQTNRSERRENDFWGDLSKFSRNFYEFARNLTKFVEISQIFKNFDGIFIIF